MAEVLCVYREVKLLKKQTKPVDAVAIVSYDEKPGVQAIGVTAPDLPPVPGIRPTVARNHEYQRHGNRQLAGWYRPAHRQGPRPRQGSPPEPRVHRVSQAP
jgi:hypothetical protein